MYEALLSIIISGDYRLADITNKINILWISGNLTDDQRTELLGQAQAHVTLEPERPEFLEMLESLAARMAGVEQRVSVLEGNSGGDTGYPEWQPWDGLSSDYQTGAIVSHNDKLWQSIYEGQNIWEPGALGTETMWVEYIPEIAEGGEV